MRTGAGAKPDDRQAEARRALSRINAESETIGSSNFARRAGSPPPDAGDLIERLGRIIGRTLGYTALAALAVYLYVTYVRPA